MKYEFTDFKFTKIAGPKKRELRGNTVSTYVLCGTALHTTVGPHLCCDNWKGQRLHDFYSVYWANEVFYI